MPIAKQTIKGLFREKLQVLTVLVCPIYFPLSPSSGVGPLQTGHLHPLAAEESPTPERAPPPPPPPPAARKKDSCFGKQKFHYLAISETPPRVS